jgi:Na+-driven multidrug efflux pump
LSGGVLKVLFNLLFVLVFDMSVESVALATILSNIFASTLALVAVLKNDQISLDFKNICFDLRELKEILFVGVPAGLQSALYSLANVVITTAVNAFGADATTGIAIANQFDGILYQIAYAPSLATIPYVAQNAGAGNFTRIKQTVLRATLITTAFGGILGCLSAVFSAELSSIMSSSPAVIAFSQQKMVIISSTYFICGINEVIGGALKGLRKPILPAIATLIYMCLFRFVWVYAIFPHYPNLTFLYLVWPIGWVLSIITLLIPYSLTLAKLRKERTVQPQTAP